MLRKICLIACLTITFTSFASQVSQLKQQIQAFHQQLQQKQSALETAETHIATLSNKINHTHKKIQTNAWQLTQLIRQAANDQLVLNQQQRILARHLVTAYMLGRQPYLKMLLNAKNPNHLSRMLTYYSDINHDRIQAIESLQHILTRITATQKAINHDSNTLMALNTTQKAQRYSLRGAQHDRKRAIHALQNQLSTKQKKLAALLRNRQHLNHTLKHVKPTIIRRINFRTLKGKLAWPAAGKRQYLFGTPIENSQITWKGMLISGKLGAPVRAIAAGKVVFAKWLPGYGFVIIIEHGHGYLSIFGRNQVLLAQKGDNVKAGEEIATLGKSGGFDTPALYFSLRHYTRALNPRWWCRR